MNTLAQRANPSSPPFQVATKLVAIFGIAPSKTPVSSAIEVLRKQWLEAMLNDALLVLLQVGEKSAKHLSGAHASLQFGFVCAIYMGLREGQPEFSVIETALRECKKRYASNATISAPFAVHLCSAMQAARLYVELANEKAIYKSCESIAAAQTVKV